MEGSILGGMSNDIDEKIKCYICYTEMHFMGIINIEILSGRCEQYKCLNCGEIIYEPISRF